MKLYLVTSAVLFIVGALGNLRDLTQGDAGRPLSNRARALAIVLQGVLGAWAVFLLLQGVLGAWAVFLLLQGVLGAWAVFLLLRGGA